MVLSLLHLLAASLQLLLYQHKDLWHPEHLSSDIRELIAAEQRISEVETKLAEGQAGAEGAACPSSTTSLLGAAGCNSPHSKASSDLGEQSSIKKADKVVRSPAPKQLALNIQWALQIVRERQQANSQSNRAQYKVQRLKKAAAEHLAKLKAWAASDDAVLANEANKQLEQLANHTGAG